MIVCVHGGPTWNWGAFFSDSEPNAVLLASAGYACLLPNPRGSIGRGHAFAQAVIGDSGGVDFRDVMSGIDALHRRRRSPIPDRLGISGLSYGGFMAGLGGRADGSLRCLRRHVGRVEQRVVPPDVRDLDVRRDDPGRGLERSGEPVRRALSRDARASMHHADAGHPGSRGSMYAGRPGRGAVPRDRGERVPRPSSSSTRGRATSRWNAPTRSTRSNGRRRGSTGTFKRAAPPRAPGRDRRSSRPRCTAPRRRARA